MVTSPSWQTAQSPSEREPPHPGGCWRWAYPAAAAAPLLLLLLLLNQLHGRGRRRGRPHGPHYLDAVLRQRRQVQPPPASHLGLLELLKPPQGELGWKDGASQKARRTRAAARLGLPGRSSRAAAGPSSWGSGGRSCCRTWLPW